MGLRLVRKVLTQISNLFCRFFWLRMKTVNKIIKFDHQILCKSWHQETSNSLSQNVPTNLSSFCLIAACVDGLWRLVFSKFLTWFWTLARVCVVAASLDGFWGEGGVIRDTSPYRLALKGRLVVVGVECTTGFCWITCGCCFWIWKFCCGSLLKKSARISWKFLKFFVSLKWLTTRSMNCWFAVSSGMKDSEKTKKIYKLIKIFLNTQEFSISFNKSQVD